MLVSACHPASSTSLCSGSPDWHDAGQEVHHLDSVVSFRVEKVETVSLLVDICRIPRWLETYVSRYHEKIWSSLVRIVLQDQLLQPQERPFMRDLLSDLHTRLPRVLRCEPRTSWALTCVDDERKDESLLQDGVGQNFFLDGDFDLDSAGMRFGPDE